MVWATRWWKKFEHMFIRFDVIHEREKIAVFTYRSPHFCFPWRRPYMDRKILNACQTPRRMYLSIFNSFRVIRCLSKSLFYHSLFPPPDSLRAITLNVVWMEREFDAYKLSRCICPSNYNRFWDRAIYWSKIVIFSYHPCIRRSRRNSATPFGTEKLEWWGYPMVKKLWGYV